MPAVVTESLTRRFGDTDALAGVDLEVAEGEVLGLLGPNGAGKTTLVRILATLLPPTDGRATVLGHDVARDPAAVRREIGLTGQYAAIDGLLTGRENLRMFGELFHLSARDARRRADELLERFDLVDAADRRAGGYSRRDAPPARPRLVACSSVRGCCSSTSRPPASTRAAATPSGRSPASSSPRARRCCSPPSTSRRPTSSPTASRSSTTAASSPRGPATSSRTTSAARSSRSGWSDAGATRRGARGRRRRRVLGRRPLGAGPRRRGDPLAVLADVAHALVSAGRRGPRGRRSRGPRSTTCSSS